MAARIATGTADRKIAFVAVDATDLKTRKTGLSTFTVYYSRGGQAATLYTTPTIAEISAVNMPGVYWLTIDEGTTLIGIHDEDEYVVHITHAGMAPVTRSIELYRPKWSEGEAGIMAASGRAQVNVREWNTVAVNSLIGGAGGRLDVSVGEMQANVMTAAAAAADLTTELQAGLALEATAQAIKAKTDSLTYTVAGQVDSNVQRINDVTITGDGQAGTEFGV